MANPLVELFYEAGGPLRFREVERTLSQCGLSLTRPGDGAVIRSSEIGEPIPSSAEEIAERAQRREWIAANFWVDEANAAHVSLWPLDDTCICESILMDTLDDSFQIAITNATVGRFRSMSGRRMVVVDLFGDSHEYVDWNAFFSDPNQPLHSAIPTPVSPTILGLDLARFNHVAGRFQEFSVKVFDEMVLASRPAKIEDFPKWRWDRYRRVGEWMTIKPIKQ